MVEETVVWSGHPSVLMYQGAVIWMVVLSLTIVLIPIALIWYLVKRTQARSTRYELTSQRLRIATGVLTKITTEIELFRIKESTLEEPFLLRQCGLGNIIIRSSDPDHQVVVMPAISHAKDVREQLRTLELSYRANGGVIREIEAN
jgi:membrane protein YdbS with pleckstrin-like domain